MVQPTEPSLLRLPKSVRLALNEAIKSGSWINVRRALAVIDECPPAIQGREVTVHVLSSFNLDPVESALRLGLRCIPCRPKLEISPFNTIDQQILDQSSKVYGECNLGTVILWRAEELFPDLFHPLSSTDTSDMQSRIDQLGARIRRLVQAYLANSSAPLLLCTLPAPAILGSLVLGSNLPTGLSRAIANINSAIFDLRSLDSRVRIADLNFWSAQQGITAYDLQMDYMAKQPLTVSGAISLGLFLARNLRPWLAPRRKVLAMDLDNTLWGGILGEDGVQKLKLGQDFPGNVFLGIQREIRELKHQGILLVLSSKNDESDVRQAMEMLPDMVLHWDDFVCRKVNFNHKYLNLREASAELGVGLDSFALLDDSDYEREQMQAFNPEVLVLNNHSDALQMLSSLLTSDVFDAYFVSDEDRSRHRDYELRSARTAKQDVSADEFLSSLDLRATLDRVCDSNIERVVQMLGKTNQFNLTTRRHGLDDLRTLLSVPGSVSLTLRLADKFGDQGIVGVLFGVPIEGDALCVDSFLVSCRALGRGVEDVLWAELLTHAVSKGVRSIHARYIPTAKNALVANFYDRLGLSRVVESAQGTDYLLTPIPSSCFPPWIAVHRRSL